MRINVRILKQRDGEYGNHDEKGRKRDDKHCDMNTDKIIGTDNSDVKHNENDINLD